MSILILIILYAVIDCKLGLYWLNLCDVFKRLKVDLTSCRYDCIENDLLDPTQEGTHIIAPYRSRDVEKASELS